jgi:hypothetical protein
MQRWNPRQLSRLKDKVIATDAQSGASREVERFLPGAYLATKEGASITKFLATRLWNHFTRCALFNAQLNHSMLDFGSPNRTQTYDVQFVKCWDPNLLNCRGSPPPPQPGPKGRLSEA